MKISTFNKNYAMCFSLKLKNTFFTIKQQRLYKGISVSKIDKNGFR